MGHSLLVAAYHMLRARVPYQDLDPEHFDHPATNRLTHHHVHPHVHPLEQLGHRVHVTARDRHRVIRLFEPSGKFQNACRIFVDNNADIGVYADNISSLECRSCSLGLSWMTGFRGRCRGGGIPPRCRNVSALTLRPIGRSSRGAPCGQKVGPEIRVQLTWEEMADLMKKVSGRTGKAGGGDDRREALEGGFHYSSFQVGLHSSLQALDASIPLDRDQKAEQMLNVVAKGEKAMKKLVVVGMLIALAIAPVATAFAELRVSPWVPRA